MYYRHSYRIILLNTFLLLLISREALAFSRYKVEKVEGEAYVRKPYQQQWYKIKKGNVLANQWLLQIKDDAKITISLGKIIDKKIHYQDMVQIRTPMIIRLDKDLLKKMNNTEITLKNLPEFENETYDAPERSPLGWKDVFHKLTLNIVNIDNIKGLNNPKDILKHQLDVLHQQKKYPIHLISPKLFDVVRAEKLPSQWNIKWDAKINEEYIVYFWSEKDETKRAFARTRSNFYTVPIDTGAYFVQIKSVDGLYQSAVHLLQVIPYEHNEYKNPILSGMTYPLDGQIFPSNKDRLDVKFQWKQMAEARTKFFLYNDDKVIDSKEILDVNQLPRVTLRNGKYKWEIIGPDDKVLLNRHFTVSDQSVINIKDIQTEQKFWLN